LGGVDEDELPPFLNTIFSKLRSFVIKPPLSIPSDDTYHTMIVIILILEHACLLYASPSKPTLNGALNDAYTRYKTSGTHDNLTNRFPTHQEPSIPQSTDFILSHRL